MFSDNDTKKKYDFKCQNEQTCVENSLSPEPIRLFPISLILLTSRFHMSRFYGTNLGAKLETLLYSTVLVQITFTNQSLTQSHNVAVVIVAQKTVIA